MGSAHFSPSSGHSILWVSGESVSAVSSQSKEELRWAGQELLKAIEQVMVEMGLTPGPSVQSMSLSPGSHLIPHSPQDVVQALLSQSRSCLQLPPLSSATSCGLSANLGPSLAGSKGAPCAQLAAMPPSCWPSPQGFVHLPCPPVLRGLPNAVTLP